MSETSMPQYKVGDTVVNWELGLYGKVERVRWEYPYHDYWYRCAYITHKLNGPATEWIPAADPYLTVAPEQALGSASKYSKPKASEQKVCGDGSKKPHGGGDVQSKGYKTR